MVSVARKNLFQEKTRLLVSMGGVAFAVLLILILVGLYQGWNKRITSYLQSIKADFWVGQSGSADLFHSVSLVPESLKKKIENNSKVKEVNKFLGRQVTFHLRGKEVNLFLVGFDTQKNIAGPLKVVQGKSLPASGEIIIDKVFAKNKDLKIGDTLKIIGQKFKIVGISKGGNMVVYQYGFISQKEAEALFKMRNTTNYFIVTINDLAKKKEVKKELEEEFPNLKVKTKESFITENKRLIREGFLPIIGVLVVVAFLIGASLIGLTIYTATVEKSQEFGVLKAVGAKNRQLFFIVFEQGFISTFLGYLLGLAATLLAVRGIENLVPAFAVSLEAADLFKVFLLAISMSIFAAYLPIRKIMKIDPAQVFRA